MCIYPQSFAGGKVGRTDHTGRGAEIVVGVVGIDAALDGMPIYLDVVLINFQRKSLRNMKLLRDEVDARDLLRNRVFDLNTCVHFQKIKSLSLDIDQKLNRTGIAISDMTGKAQRSLMQPGPQGVWQAGCRGFFDQFLVATLYGTVSVAQMNDPVPVSEYLHFYVPPTGDKPFDVDPPVAESRLCFGTGKFKQSGKLLGAVGFFRPRPPPPPTALISTGKPMDSAMASASSSDSTAPPGVTGTPASWAMRRASSLSPTRRICSAVGPMKIMLLSSQACANSARSERNP